MSLSAQDIVALARAGYNAEQISFLNKEVLSTPSTEPSTVSTQPTTSTQPTERPVESTPSTPPEVKPEPAPAAEKAADPAPTKQDPAPSMQDLMEKLAALEGRLTTAAINQDQQPDTGDQLTGEKVLAQILDPRIK